MCHPERKGNAVALKSNGSEQFHTIAICSLCCRLTAYSFQHIQLRSLGCARDDSRHPNKHKSTAGTFPHKRKKGRLAPANEKKRNISDKTQTPRAAVAARGANINFFLTLPRARHRGLLRRRSSCLRRARPPSAARPRGSRPSAARAKNSRPCR